MKDIFADRATDTFFSVLVDFIESMNATFPGCPDVQEWTLWYENIVKDDAAKRRECVTRWVDGMHAPLAKGCAKYAKAVQSITGKPATVYHAVAYRDAIAADASNEMLRSLNLPEKVSGDAMGPTERSIFWEYFDELNKHAFQAKRSTAPSVPTSQEIEQDIARRKRKGTTASDAGGGGGAPGGASGGGGGGGGGVLEKNMAEMWCEVCRACGDEKSAERTLPPTSQLPMDWAERCGRREASAWEDLQRICPYLEGKGCPDDEAWGLLQNLSTMMSMASSIPKGMLSGIETMASQIASRMGNMAEGGGGMPDMEAMSKEMMSGMSQADLSSFASNIDKILPALQRTMGGGGFP